MKNLAFIISIISFLAFLSCTSNQSEKKNSADIAKLVKAEINVKGMTCTGCENSINEKLSAIKGVEMAKSSHTDGKTWVSYDSSATNINTILSAINETGYETAEYKIVNDSGY